MSESFILYTSYYAIIEGLTDEQLGRLTRAIFIYARDGETTNLEPVVRMAFSFIKDDIDRNAGKYQKKCERLRANARKRWNKQMDADAEANANASKSIQLDANASKSMLYDNDNVNDNDNEYVNDNVDDNDVSNETVIIIPSKEGESISARPKIDAPSPSHGEIEKTAKAKKAEGRTLKTEADFNAIKNYWNDQLERTGSTMRRLTIMSEQRRNTVRARLREVGGDVAKIYRAMDIAIASPFMNGDNERGWKGNYDWLMCPKNFIKVLEGNYNDDDRPAKPAKGKGQQPASLETGRKSIGELYRQAAKQRHETTESQDGKYRTVIMSMIRDLGKNPRNKAAYNSLARFYEAGVIQRLGIDWKPKNSA